MQSKAIIFRDVNVVTVEPVTIPEPGPGEVLIETAYSVMSPGTELRCLAGQQPNAAPWPAIPGYSLSGTIVAAGPGTALAIGTRVFTTGTRQVAGANLMWGGHVAHALVPQQAVFPLPDGLALREAASAHMVAIAYHGLRLAQPLPHERIAVLGLGAIGQLAARLYTATGAHVLAADLSAGRVALAQGAGVDAFVPEGTLTDAFRRRFPEGADIVVDATGANAVLPLAIEIARDLSWDDAPTPGARLVIQGSYPASVAVPYQAAFQKEVRILVPRDMQPRDLRAVLELLSREKIRVDDLLGTVITPEEAPPIYAALRGAPGDMVTAAIRWQ